MENNTDFGFSQDYKDNSNEIRKCLKRSFGFHFLCPSDVDMGAKNPSNNKRTNNAVESFHAQFYTTHPTFFVFLEVLVIMIYSERKGLQTGNYLENSLICMNFHYG